MFRLTRIPRSARLHGVSRHFGCLHSAQATLFNPNPGTGPVHSKVDIMIGEPGEAYVMFKPQIGSILAGKPLNDGERLEIPLQFFHKTMHFAKDSNDESARLQLDKDLGNGLEATVSPSTLFHVGVMSTVALNGTPDESFARFYSKASIGIERNLKELENM